MAQYSIYIQYDNVDKIYIASIPELQGCMAHGETKEEALKELESKNPDVVIVLVHDSLQDEKHGTQSYVRDIGRKFGGRVHVVLGGHAHNIFQNEYVNGTLFVESGTALQNVSRITVETDDETGKFVSAKSELIPLVVAKTGEDADVKAYADSLREPGVDEVLGEAAETLSRQPQQDDRQDAPLNNWIADLIRNYSGAQIAVHNNGGTRVDMQKGPVTKRDLIEIHPFDNTITLVAVDGKFLKKFVKKSFAPNSLYSYSGLTITYEKNKKGKIKDIEILVNGQPVQNRRKYILATNTYIANGESTPEEIIKATKLGLYTVGFLGGQVNPQTGEFNFGCSEAYIIRDGKICEPVKGASLIGTCQEIMQNIDMVGNDLDLGAGMCGSQSGSVPVCVGQPTLRIKEITVGGRGGKLE